ncbi:Sec-independent protein translocase protein TatB [Halomonas mongoliensis]|jgi:sec-independent protein translocase protein TatB|uniref:Sec-independent protein translocase protein TatB n=1 Tax=Halomonas mongoliensis TaxID=321265 RepID=A0ABU1GJF5_9GAMM|nr:Sec-independent protein translocase protein TatB [Halomonas mongoliensis]MDR5892160.1 Sec-independent protein translocase protein TatB [Halomonas mongoliensis]
MFDIGFLELMFIGVVGLLVLGPERLPKAARTAGLWIGKIKRSVSGMQREISAQLEAEELRQKLNEQQKKLDDSVRQVQRDVESIAEPDRPAEAPEKAPAPSAEQRLDDALARARRAPSEADASEAATPNADEPTAPSASDKDASSR